MSFETTTKTERAMSVMGDGKVPERRNGGQSFSLAKVQSDGLAPRWWRVTMQRVQREDGASPIGGGSGGTPSDQGQSIALYQNQPAFAYAAGQQQQTFWPNGTFPQRARPVGGSFVFGANFVLSVQIAWGNGGNNIGRMIADWPWQGGSIVVYGSQIEVIGGINMGDITQIDPGGMPALSAFITPIDGVTPQDSGELSITQEVPLRAVNIPQRIAGGAVYVPDFARRVRVVPVDSGTAYWLPFLTQGGVIPAGGFLIAVVIFTDERGVAIDQYWMGTNAQGHVAPEWMPVPARAVMMEVIEVDPTSGAGSDTALVHWRIGP